MLPERYDEMREQLLPERPGVLGYQERAVLPAAEQRVWPDLLPVEHDVPRSATRDLLWSRLDSVRQPVLRFGLVPQPRKRKRGVLLRTGLRRPVLQPDRSDPQAAR
jgi:hypothetical protein